MCRALLLVSFPLSFFTAHPLLLIKQTRSSCSHGASRGNRPAGIQSTLREPFGTGVGVEPENFDGLGIARGIPQNCEFSASFGFAIADSDGGYPSVLSRPGLPQVPSALTLQCPVAFLAEVIEEKSVTGCYLTIDAVLFRTKLQLWN